MIRPQAGETDAVLEATKTDVPADTGDVKEK